MWVNWLLIVFLTCISLITSEVEHFQLIYWFLDVCIHFVFSKEYAKSFSCLFTLDFNILLFRIFLFETQYFYICMGYAVVIQCLCPMWKSHVSVISISVLVPHCLYHLHHSHHLAGNLVLSLVILKYIRLF